MKTIEVLTIAPQKGDIPFNRRCHFYLAKYSTDKSGKFLMTPELMTDSEVDWWSDYLIEEIEAAKKKAKRELAKYRQNHAEPK